jgi:hypothetical protein
MTGHKPISAPTRQYLLLLVVFKLILPQATYIKCIAFIANKTNHDAKVFLEKDVSKALRITGLYHEGNVYRCLSGVHRGQFELSSSLLDLAVAAWDSWDTKKAFD